MLRTSGRPTRMLALEASLTFLSELAIPIYGTNGGTRRAAGGTLRAVRDDAEARRDFAARMGPAYAGRHRAEEVALHLRLALEASPARPARVSVTAAPGGRLDVTVVGLDFFAEFALLCGVLSARGLDIESGQVHTSAPARQRSIPAGRSRSRRRPPAPPADGLPSRIIVDEFRVMPRGAAAGDDLSRLEQLLETDVVELLGLVAQGRTEEARDRLDRRLAERFARSEPPASALHPLEIGFDNDADPRWTRMEVRGPDTPGFLYALATGLALRDVYVQQVEIASVGTEARDLFLIATRDGRKIDDPAQLAGLRAAVALIKQFTHLLPFAPDPALALRSFGQLVDRLLAEAPPARPTPGSSWPRPTACGSSPGSSGRAPFSGRTSSASRPSTCCPCSTPGGGDPSADAESSSPSSTYVSQPRPPSRRRGARSTS